MSEMQTGIIKELRKQIAEFEAEIAELAAEKAQAIEHSLSLQRQVYELERKLEKGDE